MSVTRTQAPDWTGRMDPEDGPDAIRLNQLVKPGAKRAVIGFACDAGVKRNKGRIGAKEGPAALRQAVSSKGGTTLAALNTFIDAGIFDITEAAVTAAADRSLEMERENAAAIDG